MRYYIDGYNLLFYHDPSLQQLKLNRGLLLDQLNEKAALLNIDLCIVFDAAYQLGEESRSHYKALEIIYTAYQESADTYLINHILKIKNPHQVTVVTNDKKLAALLRPSFVKIESVTAFEKWLDRIYAKKLTEQQKNKKQKPLFSLKVEKKPSKASLSPQKEEKQELDGQLEHYHLLFEAKYQQMQKELQAQQKAAPKKRAKKVKLDPFDPPKKVVKAPTEMARWLKAFEEQLEEG